MLQSSLDFYWKRCSNSLKRRPKVDNFAISSKTTNQSLLGCLDSPLVALQEINSAISIRNHEQLVSNALFLKTLWINLKHTFTLVAVLVNWSRSSESLNSFLILAFIIKNFDSVIILLFNLIQGEGGIKRLCLSRRNLKNWHLFYNSSIDIFLIARTFIIAA